jgi:Protein of unknown function (DUF3047)
VTEENHITVANSRRKMMRGGTSLAITVSMVLGLLAVGPALASGAEKVLLRDDFEAGIGPGWVEQGFPSIERKNRFALAVDATGNHYLRVDSSRSSSGKGIRLLFAPDRCGEVSWRWMIAHTVAPADITRKEGDDAAAKLYVVFDGPSRWNPMDKRILVYIWDNSHPIGSVLPNAWLADKERVFILESGPQLAGQWVSERVDLVTDFMRAFPGERPGNVEALAFMADTDNTGSEVSAGFDDLVIRCAQPPSEGGTR